MNLLCAANASYAVPLAVMLTSVVSNLKTADQLNIHVIASDISGSLREDVERSVINNKAPGLAVSFRWENVNLGRFALFPETNEQGHYLSRDSYSRLLAGEILPPDCEKAVYLDCDLVVLSDIAALQRSIDEDATISAATGVFWPYVSTEHSPGMPVVFNYREMGIAPDRPYFNAGVLGMNLTHWRERKAGERTIAYLLRHAKDVFLHDQGALNAVLANEWSRLDQRWNQCSTVLDPDIWKAPEYSHAQWERTFRDPYIVHYDGPSKPWLAGARQPRMSYYFQYLNRTVFADGATRSPFARAEALIGIPAYYRLWTLYRRAKDRMRPASPVPG